MFTLKLTRPCGLYVHSKNSKYNKNCTPQKKMNIENSPPNGEALIMKISNNNTARIKM